MKMQFQQGYMKKPCTKPALYVYLLLSQQVWETLGRRG